ncbi:MAG: efflux RND transporter periplasmic adaptor subunit [Desulfuromonadales bacterium]|nr:efflux RND transporter periplasmic adaptor subunit [Desulfuromonadales bacterium]
MNRRSAFVVIIVTILVVSVTYGLKRSGRQGGADSENTSSAGSKPVPGGVVYTCPMHPFILKDRPGTCPICNMELVQKINGAELSDNDLRGVRHVALSPTQQVIANLATVTVGVKPFTREIKCTGIVAFNQERQGKVSAWVAGRLDRLLVKSVGTEVRKGMPVAELYSVDLYNAEAQYLMAYKTLKILNSSLSVTFPINTQMSLGDAYERLRQLGFSEEQFIRLQKSTSPSIRVPIYSPFSGVVTEKLVKEGQYVNVGDPLFAIADLSRIWVELEVFESDFPFIKVGQDVTIHSRSYPGEPSHGKVKLIYPFLDAKSRTIKIRVEIPNPGLKLKPEMYVQAAISVPQTASLVIPAAAVKDTGTRQVVWVESRPGVFQSRDVKTGARFGKELQILSGLKAGEKVATTGGYLIDSEAQLSRGAEETQKPPAATEKPAAAPAKQAPSPSPAHKDEMDMKDMKMN